MKKLKFLGTAVLAASLLFAGCSSQVEEEAENNNGKTPVVIAPEPDEPENPPVNNPPVASTEPASTIGDLDISGYYKKFLVSTSESVAPSTIDPWSSGTKIIPAGDGSYTLKSANLWGGSSGACIAFMGFDAGTFANYEYIAFTVDTTEFTMDYTEGGNTGVNLQLAPTQMSVTSRYTADGKKRTYYVPMSIYGNTVDSAVQFGLIIGGSGSLKVTEVYLAATENPDNRAITGISISPVSATILQNGKTQFTVKDSNNVNLTSDVTYTLSGDAAVDSSITSDGILTAGTTPGSLIVKASYESADTTFTAEANITVLGAMTNLVSSIVLEKYVDSAGGDDNLVTLNDGVFTVAKPVGTTGWGNWSSQLWVTLSPESGNMFETGKKYYVSLTLQSDSDLTECIWKGDDIAGYILQEHVSLAAGVEKTLVQEVEFSASFENFQCILAFGANANAANIKVSDFLVYDITPEVK